MKFIEFKDPSAQKLYRNYIKQAEKATKVLSTEDQEDILMEMNSHIYEAVQKDENRSSEIEILVNIIDQLGGSLLVLGIPNLEYHPEAVELLGNWFIPVIALVTVLLYFLITFLLKLKNHFKNENQFNF